MKATGIVRRIDDLGRVVIPKEIRRTMRIREGDPLEIYTSAGGEVIFKKYSPMGELAEFSTQYAEVLASSSKFPVLICDRDHCVAAAGISKKEVLERRISPEIEEIMENRQSKKFEDDSVLALEGLKRSVKAISPIINAGDIGGAVIMIADEMNSPCTDADLKMLSVAAQFLAKQME